MSHKNVLDKIIRTLSKLWKNKILSSVFTLLANWHLTNRQNHIPSYFNINKYNFFSILIHFHVAAIKVLSLAPKLTT